MNVLPLVNKGLALYQWKQDLAAAEELCQEALSVSTPRLLSFARVGSNWFAPVVD